MSRACLARHTRAQAQVQALPLPRDPSWAQQHDWKKRALHRISGPW